MTKPAEERCPKCGSASKGHYRMFPGIAGPERCDHPWHSAKVAPEPPTPPRTKTEIIDGLARAEMDEGIYDRMPSWEPRAAKLTPREWLCSGGGGHEDGEDGIRAGRISMNSAVELMEEYVEYLGEPRAEQPPAMDWKIIGSLLDAWEGADNSFKSDMLDQYPALHRGLDALSRFVESEEPRAEGQWISVTDSLPEDGASVLVYVPEWEDLYLRNQVAWINYDELPPSWVNNGESLTGVTHWQPLPAPPEKSR